MMPGALLHRIARRVCPQETDWVFDPLIADLQREWHDARPGTRRALALARGYMGFWHALGSCAASAIARAALSPIAPDVARPATAAFACALLAVPTLRIAFALLGMTGLRIFGTSWGYWHRPLSTIALGELQTVGWSVVFAVLPALMYARRAPERRWNAGSAKVLIAGLVITIVCLGWLGPAILRASMPRAWHPEETPAFRSLPSVVQTMRAARFPDEAAPWRRELHRRAATGVTTLLLGLIGWRLSGLSQPSVLRAAFWWFALMEFVLVSGAYAINQAEWQQWRASGLLVLILLALRTAPRRNASALPALPA